MSVLRRRATAALERGRPDEAWDLLATAWNEGEPRTRHTARRLLAAVIDRVPEAAWTSGRAHTARSAALHRQSRPSRVGVVAFPAVGPAGDRFLAVEVGLLDADEDALPRDLDTATRLALHRALDAARELLDTTQSFSVAVPTQASWHGPSCGLATGLAAISAARRIPLDETLAATGELRADGIVEGVGGLGRKLELRFAARPRGRLLVARDDAVAGHPAVVPVRRLSEALEGAGVHARDDLDDRLDTVKKLDREGAWAQAAREAQTLWREPDLDEEQRVEMLAVLVSAANHAGDGASSQRWLDALEPLMELESAGEALARVFASRVVARVDQLDPHGAREAVAATSAIRWGEKARVHLRGAEALVSTLSGDLQTALMLRQENQALAGGVEQPRCCGDLADALMRLGHYEEALSWAEAGLARSETARRQGYQLRTRRFLHLHRARALHALRRPEEARASLLLTRGDVGPDPALRARLLEAELDGDLAAIDHIEAGLAPWLGGLPLVRALLERARGRLGDAEAQARFLSCDALQGMAFEEAALFLPY